jgi:hypothetical protein
MVIWIIILAYALCSVIAGVKQSQVLYNDESYTMAAVIFGPFWLFIAIIRQTLIEKWQ